MGLAAKRYLALQGALWTLCGLIEARNHTSAQAQREAGNISDKGKEALVLVCLMLVLVTIIAISAHYCNFRARHSYDQLLKETSSELVEINLDESDEE